MADRLENQLIAELSRKIVTEVAPEERRAFQPISEAYFKSPKRHSRAKPVQMSLLVFGVYVICSVSEFTFVF